MILSHGALLSPETTVLSPRVTSRRVACGHYTPPHPPPTRRRGWRVHPSTARHHPWPRQRRAPRVPPTPFRFVAPPLYLFSITLHDPKPDSLRYSLAFNHNSYSYPQYRTRTRTRTRVHFKSCGVRARRPGAPAPISCLHVARWQTVRMVCVGRLHHGAHNETRVE
jgi:hypothetical protein